MERIDKDFVPMSRCYICGDEDDHNGVPHGVATGDNITRDQYDRGLEVEWLLVEHDGRCTCTSVDHSDGRNRGARCINAAKPEHPDYCTACVFGCLSWFGCLS